MTRPQPAPTPHARPATEAQAQREVGHTRVGDAVARALAALFALTVVLIPLLEPLVEHRTEAARDADAPDVFEPFRSLAQRLPETVRLATRGRLVTANRHLLAALDDFEDRLEEGSWLRDRLLPATQTVTSAWLGLGNEQAYVGRDRWLFYRVDVDYVTGPGFLRPDVLRRRRRSGESWESPPQPDPVPALVDFERQLAARGIRLLVMPTPVKPTIEPDRLSRRTPSSLAPVQNPSFAELVQRLRTRGIEIFDPAPLLAVAKEMEDGHQYLRTDTHWRPEAVDRVARELASRIEALVELDPATAGLFRREVTVEGRGDIVAMLRLPDGQELFPPERVALQRVLDWEGASAIGDRGAEILLLGDSFSNVYSDPTLGWGAGAGLAEQLAYHLQRQVDKIALNAGGAAATRRALARRLSAEPDRLDTIEIVIYQFATRELAIGDWELVEVGG